MEPERLDVTSEELEALLEGVRAPLGEASYQKLQAAIRTLSYVTELLETREATLDKLLLRRPRAKIGTARLFRVASTEVVAQKVEPFFRQMAHMRLRFVDCEL